MIVPALSAVSLLSMLGLSSASFSLLVLGDWGGFGYRPYTTPGQLAAAKGMGKVGQSLDIDGVIALGDNFYFEGVDNVDSHRFEATFEQVYDAGE